MEISGRVAIVTGAGSGLGEVIAQRLGIAGALVLVVDRDRHRAEDVSSRIVDGGGRAVPMHADVLEAVEREAVVGLATGLGGPHILVNNAGGWGVAGRQFPEASPEEWRTVLELNLSVPVEMTQRCVPLMARHGGGSIVNISSSAGREVTAYGSPEYAAAKAGLIRFTTAAAGLARDCNVRVNCVVPNWIGLPRAVDEFAAMPAAERDATPPLIPPEDVAAAVTDFVVDDSLSGRVAVLEGGERRRLLEAG